MELKRLSSLIEFAQEAARLNFSQLMMSLDSNSVLLSIPFVECQVFGSIAVVRIGRLG
jgi:hypothetical protein